MADTLTDEQIDALWAKETLDITVHRRFARAVLASAAPKWISVADQLPASGVTVLACYRNSAGNVRRIRACWVAEKTCESNPDGEIGEYDEATDTYYDPAGWYEQIDNWDEYTSVTVHEGDVAHWMHMPPPPETKP